MRIIIFIMIAYLNLTARITVGQAIFNNISSFTITESVKDLSDQAVITLARNYKLLDKPILDYIHSGMPVKIECGYNGDLQTEFEGFVKPGIDADFPVVIECDQLFPLRKNNWVLSFQNISLRELLVKIAPGYIIEAPDVQLGKLIIDNASTLEVLKDLENKWGLFFKIHSNILCAGWPFDFRPSFTKLNQYTIGLNVRNYKGLKFIQDNDFNTVVRVNVAQKDGKKNTYDVSVQNGKTIARKNDKTALVDKIINTNRTGISDADAINYGKGILRKSVYDGYFGILSGFCLPRTKAGDTIEIIDNLRPERNGQYVTERTVLNYADAHIKRDCHISFKADSDGN